MRQEAVGSASRGGGCGFSGGGDLEVGGGEGGSRIHLKGTGRILHSRSFFCGQQIVN